MRLACYSLLFISVACTCKVTAQADKITDSLTQKVYWYGLQNPSATMFVHFDKNIYTNNENVWFTAYILKNNTKAIHHTLSVALIRNDDRTVLAEGKFVMDRWCAYGNMYLPDSLPVGDYSFVCYTNHLVKGYPSALFIQPVTIKSANRAAFVANLSLVDSITPGMDTAKVLLKAYTADVKLLRGGEVNYFIGDRSHLLKIGKLKTDNFGEVRIPIPLREITTANNILQTQISNGKEVKTFSVKLPVYKKDAVVKFYPEGGNLVYDVNNTVGWEVTDNEGEPAMVSGGLYKDDQLLQAVKTDAYGVGRFTITPQQGSRYYVKFKYADTRDTSYFLPHILQGAPVINLTDALASDTLVIHLNTPRTNSKWLVMLHDYKSTFLTSPVVTTMSSTLIKIALTDVPKGLATFTLFDPLGRPWAERLFFAHFDNKALVNISTDSTSYAPRQKVELNFKITNAQQKPLKSLVSIACVQDNRFDIKKTTDIESYVYLRSELNALPFKNKLLSDNDDNKEYLENLLLVKGWRRYTWQDVAIVTAKDTMQQNSSMRLKGTTLLYERPLKKPVQLNLKKFIDVKVSTLEFLTTDSTGQFELSPANLLSEPERKLELSVNNKMKENYNLQVNDPYKEMSKNLAGSLLFHNYDAGSFDQTSQSVVLKKEEGGNRLLDVKVVATKDYSIFSARVPGPNSCGDYVCMYGVLNCPNHPSDGFQPIVGMTYTHKSAGTNTGAYTSVYEGCESLRKDSVNAYLFLMQGIYKKKDFYVNDLTKTDASDPQYLSTLYWNHALLTNEKGEGKATFYTGDITGKFRIIIQGITNNDVIYGEHTFEVRRK